MRKLFILIVICLGVGAILWADRWLDRHWRVQQQLEHQATSDLMALRLKNGLSSRFDAVEALAALFVLHPNTTQQEFNHFASFLLKTNPPIKALQYADADTRITYTYPLKGNEITIQKPIVLRDDPTRGPFVRKAISQKEASLQGPFELRQGGRGVVIRMPIFDESRFLGLAIGVFDLDALLKEALNGMDTQEMKFRLADEEGNVFLGEAQLSDNRWQVKNLPAADVIWSLGIGPKANDERELVRTRLLIWLSGTGLLLSILMVVAAFWIRADRLVKMVEKRTRDLSRVNSEMAKEIAHHQKTALNLERYKDKLARLNAHLLMDIERERAAIADAIHDDLAQRLTAFKMELSWVKKRLTPQQDKLSKKINQMADDLGNTIRSVKQMCYNLRPIMLDEVGLIGALQWYVADFNTRHKARVHLSVSPADIEVQPALGMGIFRIVQEALVNSVQHAGATQIEIALTSSRGEIQAAISDNGKGMDASAIDQDGSFGISSMRERANAHNGLFEMRGQPGKGTFIRVTFPIPSHPDLPV